MHYLLITANFSGVQSFRIGRSGQTQQTQLRLLSLVRAYTVCNSVCIFCMPYSSLITANFSGVQSFRIDMSGQTVQTQIRLLLEEQSDQGLHCLQFCLHLLHALLFVDYSKFFRCPKFSDRYVWANSADPDQTAPRRVWSGSTLFAILSASFGCITLRWLQQIFRCLKFSDRYVWANSADPNQTAPRGAVWSGSTLFAILSTSFGCITLRWLQQIFQVSKVFG